MIKAIFPEGVTAMTVNGLTQWDYGQTLQIQASGLPALVEVHFACEGMNEAVVRSCSAASGTLTAAIPDICLEQNSPVMAWVYIVGESSGITTLTVTLPIIARTRPQPNATVPTETSDKYTEAIAAMNEAVNDFKNGEFKVAAAEQADKATSADSATVASRVSAVESSASEFRNVWFSRGTTGNSLNERASNTNFQYNPGTDTLKVGDITGNARRLRTLGSLAVSVSAGSGAFSTGGGLETNRFYLVVFSGRSGVIYKSSAANNSAAIGEYIISISGGEQSDAVQILKTDGGAVANVSGTVYFYQLGYVS